MILGVAGRNAAGKGALVGYLQDCGFLAHSLSDELREELAARGEKESRAAMIDLGQAVRRREGAAALAHRVLRKLPLDRNHVVDSIRHPAEVEALRLSESPFFLLWVDADERTRFERLRARDRPGDAKTLEEMRALEARELSSDLEEGQQLEAVRGVGGFNDRERRVYRGSRGEGSRVS